jgi:CreA protein
MIAMRATVLTFASFIALAVPAFAQTRIDAINTNFRWLGPDDKIVVERYDDPKVTNVSCYLSRAETGGLRVASDLPKTRVDFQSRAERLAQSLSRLD